MIKVKPVKVEDFDKIVNMLQAISSFIPNNEEKEKIWSKFTKQNNVNGFSFFLDDELIGYGSILYEIKIRGGKAGHIEDIVVDDGARGKGLGKYIINHLVKDAVDNNCYKISLSCKENNIGFYEKCGFMKDGVTMQKKL